MQTLYSAPQQMYLYIAIKNTVNSQYGNRIFILQIIYCSECHYMYEKRMIGTNKTSQE